MKKNKKNKEILVLISVVLFVFSCTTSKQIQSLSSKQEISQMQTTVQKQTDLKPVIFFDDVFPSYAYTYPDEGLYSEDTDEKKSGLASAKFQWRAGKGKWCGAGIGLLRPVDLTPYRQNGKLEFWIKGEKGYERVDKIGLQDSKGYYSMRPLRLYLKEITPDWQKVSIPLSHFSDDAAMWDSVAEQEIPGTIDWSSIVQVNFDFGEGTGTTNTIYVDEIKVIP